MTSRILGDLLVEMEYNINKYVFFSVWSSLRFCYLRISRLYLNISRSFSTSLPYFYSSPEQPNQTLAPERAFRVFTLKWQLEFGGVNAAEGHHRFFYMLGKEGNIFMLAMDQMTMWLVALVVKKLTEKYHLTQCFSFMAGNFTFLGHSHASHEPCFCCFQQKSVITPLYSQNQTADRQS